MNTDTGHRAIPLLALLCALLGAGCRRDEPVSALPASNVVAVVSGTPIFAESLSAEMVRRFGASGVKPTPAQRAEALDALIRKEALYAKAVTAGFDQKPEIRARVRGLIAERFADQAFVTPSEPVSDLVVSNAYVADRAKYTVPASVRYSAILVTAPTKASEEARTAMDKKVSELLAEAKAAPASFATLAARVSEDQATRYRGGDAGWITLEGRNENAALVAELKKLSKAGDIGGPVRTERGFQIVQLTELRSETVRPLAEVRDRIRHELIRQHANDAQRRNELAIREGLEIQVFNDRVEAISTPVQEPRPPRGPGGTKNEVSQSVPQPVSE